MYHDVLQGRYTIAWPAAELQCPDNILTEWQRIFFKQCMSTSAIYLRAPANAVRAYLVHLCKNLGLDNVSDESLQMPSSRLALDTGKYHRFRKYREAFKEKGLKGPSFFINLTQNYSYHSCLDEVAPALLTRSFLFNLSDVLEKERVIHPLEHFAIQGFAIWATAEPKEQSENGQGPVLDSIPFSRGMQGALRYIHVFCVAMCKPL